MSQTHYAPRCHCYHAGTCHHAACGQGTDEVTDDRASVTCRRCLASLAKRDREFRAKAAQWLEPVKSFRRLAHLDQQESVLRGRGRMSDAAAAIAREEGRP